MGQTTKQVGYRFASLLARNAMQPIWEFLYLTALRGLGYNNPLSQLNGEERFARDWVERHGSNDLVVFDVGANEGNFTGHLRSLGAHSCRYFLFEPNPKTFRRLEARFATDDRVHIEQVGVGAASGKLPLYDITGSQGTQWASFHKASITELVGKPSEQTYADVITLDGYCAARGIERIDFLKIDTEGFEKEVLVGAHELLRWHKIRTIQLEWNDLNVFSGFTLYQLSKLLCGFEIYRLLPRGLAPLVTRRRAYSTRFDIPRYCNLVCFDPGYAD